MRDNIFKIKGWVFLKTARALTKAQLSLTEMKGVSDADKSEMLLFLLRKDKSKTMDEFNDMLDQLSDEEYIKALNAPVKRVTELGKLMADYTSEP